MPKTSSKTPVKKTVKKVASKTEIKGKTSSNPKSKTKVHDTTAVRTSSKSLKKESSKKKILRSESSIVHEKKSTAPLSPPLKNDAVSSEMDGVIDELDIGRAPEEKAAIYDEIISQELERELIRSQRKQMAGKEQGKKEQKKLHPAFTPRVPLDKVIEIPDVITVKEFAEKTGLGAAKVIGELMKNGILANINQQIDYDTSQIIADDLKIKIKKKISSASAEDVFKGNLDALLKEDNTEDLKQRPPIVVVMGHVDHGKTTLLDFIRSEHVAAKESGGITQHIGAYQVEKNNRKITFLDTPGHEAFTAMRARGAKVTDIAVLVVAADEGVKPQTIEALQHAQAAEVPIIVAINKMDKEGAAPERVKGELGEYGLIPEEWGGKTIMVPVSAMTGEGIPKLLEMILLVADLENLKANPLRKAIGTVIEAHLHPNLGPVATVIVNTGTLKLMDNILVGTTYGRVKLMKDYTGKNVKEAGPSCPVLIAGLTQTPFSGDIFQVMVDEKAARDQAIKVQTLKEADIAAKRGVGEIISQISSGKMKQLKLVLKTDTKGSLEAIRQALSQIKHEDVGVKIILSGVGNVTESDVMMAAAANGIVMGFHTDVNMQVQKTAQREGVEVLKYTVIYKLLDDIKKILTGLLEPEMVETILGRAYVKQIFLTKKKEMIVGCKVISGKVEKVKVRIFRNEEKVGDGQINSLRKIDQTVHEVAEGNECGIMYSGFLPLQVGDILEAYKMEKRVRTL